MEICRGYEKICDDINRFKLSHVDPVNEGEVAAFARDLNTAIQKRRMYVNSFLELCDFLRDHNLEGTEYGRLVLGGAIDKAETIIKTYRAVAAIQMGKELQAIQAARYELLVAARLCNIIRRPNFLLRAEQYYYNAVSAEKKYGLAPIAHYEYPLFLLFNRKESAAAPAATNFLEYVSQNQTTLIAKTPIEANEQDSLLAIESVVYGLEILSEKDSFIGELLINTKLLQMIALNNTGSSYEMVLNSKPGKRSAAPLVNAEIELQYGYAKYKLGETDGASAAFYSGLVFNMSTDPVGDEGLCQRIKLLNNLASVSDQDIKNMLIESALAIAGNLLEKGCDDFEYYRILLKRKKLGSINTMFITSLRSVWRNMIEPAWN